MLLLLVRKATTAPVSTPSTINALPVSRVEFRAAGVGPTVDSPSAGHEVLAWGGRTATEPYARTASRASGDGCDVQVPADDDLIWGWRKKYSSHVP